MSESCFVCRYNGLGDAPIVLESRVEASDDLPCLIAIALYVALVVCDARKQHSSGYAAQLQVVSLGTQFNSRWR